MASRTSAMIDIIEHLKGSIFIRRDGLYMLSQNAKTIYNTSRCDPESLPFDNLDTKKREYIKLKDLRKLDRLTPYDVGRIIRSARELPKSSRSP